MPSRISSEPKVSETLKKVMSRNGTKPKTKKTSRTSRQKIRSVSFIFHVRLSNFTSPVPNHLRDLSKYRKYLDQTQQQEKNNFRASNQQNE